MTDKPVARTPGATRVGPGEHLFELAKIDPIMGGRIIVALMRMPAEMNSEPHSHPNEQWTSQLEGNFCVVIDGEEDQRTPGTVPHIPANTIRHGRATPEEGRVFFAVKDAGHGLQGNKVI